MYQLKKGQEAFTPVEGPLAGREFIPGKLYGEIPPGEAKRFTEIKTDSGDTVQHHVPEIPGKPAKADSKRTGHAASSEKGGGKS